MESFIMIECLWYLKKSKEIAVLSSKNRRNWTIYICRPSERIIAIAAHLTCLTGVSEFGPVTRPDSRTTYLISPHHAPHDNGARRTLSARLV